MPAGLRGGRWYTGEAKGVVFPICEPSQRGKTCSTLKYLTAADWQKMHEIEPCKDSTTARHLVCQSRASIDLCFGN
jgi:hypothetical protein